jgi:hypothetical protein
MPPLDQVGQLTFAASRFRGLRVVRERLRKADKTKAALTNLSASYQGPLLIFKGCMTCTSFQKLDKAIRLLDRDLGQFAVTVEDMEHVSLCHSLGGEIA